MFDFDFDIEPIVATNDGIAMDVNEEPVWFAMSPLLMLHCTFLSHHSPKDGLHHNGIFTSSCVIVDSRTNLFDEGRNDVEVWYNHGLKKDQGAIQY